MGIAATLVADSIVAAGARCSVQIRVLILPREHRAVTSPWPENNMGTTNRGVAHVF